MSEKAPQCVWSEIAFFVKVIAGLGNPGPKYTYTRHNLGFRALEALARTLHTDFDREKHQGLLAQAMEGSEKLMLVKPLTFMNRSGDCLAPLLRNKISSPESLLVVVDDINLPLGKLRFRAGGSAGGHNGLKSLIERVGCRDFHRLRMGVGSSNPSQDLADHVLAKFHPDEQPDVNAMLELAPEAILCWVRDGIEAAMCRYN